MKLLVAALVAAAVLVVGGIPALALVLDDGDETSTSQGVHPGWGMGMHPGTGLERRGVDRDDEARCVKVMQKLRDHVHRHIPLAGDDDSVPGDLGTHRPGTGMSGQGLGRVLRICRGVMPGPWMMHGHHDPDD